MAGVKIEALKGAGAEGAEGVGSPSPLSPPHWGRVWVGAVPPPQKKIAFFASKSHVFDAL